MKRGDLKPNWGNNVLEDTNVFEEANRLDAGLGGRVGISFKRCSVSLGYDLGLLTLDKKGSESIYNRNLHFSIGYRFQPQEVIRALADLLDLLSRCFTSKEYFATLKS